VDPTEGKRPSMGLWMAPRQPLAGEVAITHTGRRSFLRKDVMNVSSR
jgi:hypothetical protein